MEQLANRIASKIASELTFDGEKKQVLSYGLTAILQSVVMTITVAVLGALLHVFFESLTICFAVSLLRKYSGGAHAQTIASCTVVGILTCLLFGLIAQYMGDKPVPDLIYIILILIIFLYSLAIAVQKAPVDSPNKPIRTETKKKRMKKATIFLLSLYLVVSTILFLYRDSSSLIGNIMICLLFSTVWQMSSLTKGGKIALEGLDRVVYRIITLKGGHNNEKN